MLVMEEIHILGTFLLTWLFSRSAFINKEYTGCIKEKVIDAINKTAIGAIIVPKNLPYCFLTSCFTVSVALSINRPESSSNIMIFIISSISSFELNKLYPFPALTAPCPVSFLSNLSNTDKVALVISLGSKTSLVKEKQRLIMLFCPNYPLYYLTFYKEILLIEFF